MGLRINTNSLSLMIQRQLARTNAMISRAVKRLSSGRRINSASDDPAGIALDVRLDSQRRGFLQSIRNLNDSQSVLSTADGVLAEQTNLIHRMRELAIQSANGSLTDANRKLLDLECQQLLQEFDRLGQQTQFNGRNLLDGSFQTTNIQVGTNKGESIAIALPNMRASVAFAEEIYKGTSNFTKSSISVGADWPSGITMADMNNDGVQDLISVGNQSQTISLSLGNGDGTYQTRRTVATGNQTAWTSDGVAAGDLNGDGIKDLVVVDSADNTVSIYIGNGNGTFKTRVTAATGAQPSSIVLADFNGDDVLDALVGNGTSLSTSVLLGNGDGTFATQTSFVFGSTVYSAQASDVNGDGRLDMIVANFSGLSVRLGNGDGTFQAATTLATESYPIWSTAADVNNDGLIDLISSDYTANCVSVFLGNGNGTFASRRTIATGTSPTAVSVADFNGDGKIDITTSDRFSPSVSVMLGNGDGSFQTRKTLSVSNQVTALVTGDLNGDEVADIAVANVAGTLDLFTNNSVLSSRYRVSIATQSDAEDMLDIFDTALEYVNEARTQIGAFQNRLGIASSLADNQIESLASARSQISDLDFAQETAEFARLQILQSAQTASLSQANLNLRLVLQLLQ